MNRLHLDPDHCELGELEAMDLIEPRVKLQAQEVEVVEPPLSASVGSDPQGAVFRSPDGDNKLPNLPDTLTFQDQG